MRTPREIELKLECDPSDLRALDRHPLLRQADPSAPQLLDTTYFDTPRLVLREAGFSLRLRHGNGTSVQTLKSASVAAGLFDRAEWEWEVPGGSLDLGLLAKTPATAVLAGSEQPALKQQFRTLIERTTRPVRHGESRIAVTLDAGRIETPSGDVPVCEAELELQEGRPSDLFELARALGEAVPLRLGALSKGERGFALVEETLRKPRKAEPPSFDSGVSVGEAFVRIARACLQQLCFNETVFIHTRDPEALHQMRVGLRRLRSAYALFKPMLKHEPQAQDLREALKRITEPLGRARNLDVFVDETLAREIDRRPEESGLRELREHLSAERAQAHQRVRDVLASAEWRGLLVDLVAWLEAGAWRDAGHLPHRDEKAEDFAAVVLDRLRRRVRKRGKHLARLAPEARHRLRIEAKKLRYGAEFFGPLFPEKKLRRRQKDMLAALSDLQDYLGGLNDFATAHAIADGLIAAHQEAGSGPSAGALFGAGLTAADSERRSGELLARAQDAYDNILEVRRFWR